MVFTMQHMYSFILKFQLPPFMNSLYLPYHGDALITSKSQLHPLHLLFSPFSLLYTFFVFFSSSQKPKQTNKKTGS